MGKEPQAMVVLSILNGKKLFRVWLDRGAGFEFLACIIACSHQKCQHVVIPNLPVARNDTDMVSCQRTLPGL
jgi:hypothetical protein